MRHTVRQLVGDIEPFDRVEADHRADVLAWLASDAEIFRTAKPFDDIRHGAGIGFDPHLPRFIAKLRARPNVT